MHRLDFQARFFGIFFFVVPVCLGGKLFGGEFQPKEHWRFTTGNLVCSVACDTENGRVFCGSGDNKLYCLDSSGHLIWSYLTGGHVVGVAYDAESGRVFCGSGDHTLYCLDGRGNLLWSYATESAVNGVACDAEHGRVFCGSGDNKLYCLNSSGGLLWSYPTGNYVRDVVYDAKHERVFCGSGDNKLYCLDSNGHLIWSYATGSWVKGIACDAENGRVFCGSGDNKLYCLDSNGRLIWSYTTGNIVNGVAYDPEMKRIFCGSEDNNLYCLDSDRNLVWKHQTNRIKWHLSCDLDQNNQILFAPLANALAAIQYGPGKALKQEKQDQKITTLRNQVQFLGKEKQDDDPTISNRDCFTRDHADTNVIGFNFEKHYGLDPLFTPFLSQDNRVYAVSKEGDIHCFAQTKELLWKETAHKVSSLSAPRFTPEGRVCFLSQKGDIIYLKEDGSTLAIYPAQDQQFFSPFFDSFGHIYFVSQFGAIYRIDEKGVASFEKNLFGPFSQIDAFPFYTRQNLYWILVGDGKKILTFDSKENIYFGEFTCIDKENINRESLVLDADKNTFFVTNSNCLKGVDCKGALFWEYYPPCSIISPLAIDQKGVIYFGGSDKNLYCIDPKNQSICTIYSGERISRPPQFGLDGRLFFLTDAGHWLWTEDPFPNLWHTRIT